MVFSSLFFLFLFLPISLFFYYVGKKKTRDVILILCSLFFYAWGEPKWVILLIFSATVDYFNGKLIELNRDNWKAKAALISSICINLGVLFIFKYLGFFVNNFDILTGRETSIPIFSLPVGISFYTFQTLSYTFDVYNGEVKSQQSYLKFLMFVSLFHQLVAGPIVRYKDIAEEIDNRILSFDRFSYGVNRFVIGLGKKVIIANTAGELSTSILEQSFYNLTVLGSWYGILLFSIQIYFDFSGYSDMAIGLGHMFGFTYKENFDYPYISTSATEFWRRWHISLGSFFRDYLYIPLGGNRSHHLRNILLVWTLTGLWHGSSWNFIVWGLFYGIIILFEKLFLEKWLRRIPKILSHLYLCCVVLIGWTLFYFTDFSELIQYMKIMIGLEHHPIMNTALLITVSNSIFFIILSILFATPIPFKLWRKINVFVRISSSIRKSCIITINILLLITSISLLVGDSYNPFLYFRF